MWLSIVALWVCYGMRYHHWVWDRMLWYSENFGSWDSQSYACSVVPISLERGEHWGEFEVSPDRLKTLTKSQFPTQRVQFFAVTWWVPPVDVPNPITSNREIAGCLLQHFQPKFRTRAWSVGACGTHVFYSTACTQVRESSPPLNLRAQLAPWFILDSAKTTRVATCKCYKGSLVKGLISLWVPSRARGYRARVCALCKQHCRG